MEPVAQRDFARLRPRCQALRDNRSLLRITPAPPPRRSGQNLHRRKTVPINWQITWHTIPLLDQPLQDQAIALVRRKVGIGLRLGCNPRDGAVSDPLSIFDVSELDYFGLGH